MTIATPDAALQAELDDRYGRRRRRWPWAVLAVLVVAVIGYLGWSVVTQSIDQVDADTTGFELIDAHSVSVTFQVTARRGAAITCALEAQDTDHGVVGWKIVEYPADEAHTRAFSETIPTVAEATTGFVTSCWIP
jgi:hypothetical protein